MDTQKEINQTLDNIKINYLTSDLIELVNSVLDFCESHLNDTVYKLPIHSNPILLSIFYNNLDNCKLSFLQQINFDQYFNLAVSLYKHGEGIPLKPIGGVYDNGMIAINVYIERNILDLMPYQIISMNEVTLDIIKSTRNILNNLKTINNID